MNKYHVFIVAILFLIAGGRQELTAQVQVDAPEELLTRYRDLPFDCGQLGDGVVAACGGVCDLNHVQVGPIVIAIVTCPPGNEFAGIIDADDEVIISFDVSQVQEDFVGKRDRNQIGDREGCGVKAKCTCEKPPGWNQWNCVPGKFGKITWPEYEHFGNDSERIFVSIGIPPHR